VTDWWTKPQTGTDQADAHALATVIELLDSITQQHRTDAFRILARRYESDLRRMVREDAERKAQEGR
jgi:nitrate reductase alpha subunit